MASKHKWISILIVLMVAAALWYTYPPFDVKDQNGNIVAKGKLNLGLDLQGGMHLLLEVDTSQLTPQEAKDAPQRALEIIRNRIDQFGVLEPSIQLQGGNRILIQLPGVSDRERAKELIGKTAHLEFKIVADDPELVKKVSSGEIPEGYELKKSKERQDGKTEDLLVEKTAVLTGDMLVNATTEFSQQTFGMPYVSLEFNTKGADIFADVTGKNVGKRLAIVLDGEVYTAPVIREMIPSGRAQITGNFSIDEAKDIALVLRAGALPAPVKIIEERSVGAALGKDSIDAGIRATIIGAIAVLIFMAGYYLVAGMVADFAVVLNVIFIAAIMSFFKSTLTLPGIAGLVLTVGMAVDANVLIFERMREESNLGKPIRAVIDAGYHKAFWAILDSNLTTLIAGLILFQFGVGPVRGFATTLCIGIVTSMFTALTVTHLVFNNVLVGAFKVAKLNMLHLFSKLPTIPFMRIRKWAYLFSLVIITLGIGVFMSKGDKMLGVDFSGGSLYEFSFKQVVPASEVRNALNEAGLKEATIQQIGDGKEIIVRSTSGQSSEIVSKLKAKFGDGSFDVLRVEEVGPVVGKEMSKIAVKAVILAFLGILIYVTIRFDFKFAVGGIVALFHDIAIALGFLALTGREVSVSVIAAILTIIGYSINDTVVIFDRIREEKKFMRKASTEEIFDKSINVTMSRTILTSSTVIMVLLALFFFGGSVINDFAFVLLVGVLTGTYSTVFVAAPIVVDWERLTKKVAPKRKR